MQKLAWAGDLLKVYSCSISALLLLEGKFKGKKTRGKPIEEYGLVTCCNGKNKYQLYHEVNTCSGQRDTRERRHAKLLNKRLHAYKKKIGDQFDRRKLRSVSENSL